MRRAGCLDDKYNLNMDLLGEAFHSGRLDINLLPIVLGTKELSSVFDKMQSE